MHKKSWPNVENIYFTMFAALLELCLINSTLKCLEQFVCLRVWVIHMLYWFTKKQKNF